MSTQTPGGGGVGTLATSQRISPGILTDVSVFTEDILEQSFETFVTIDITRSGTLRGDRVQNVTSGYISELSPLSWHGIIFLNPNEFIRTLFQGNLDPIFRVIIRKLTPENEREIRKIFNEPTRTT